MPRRLSRAERAARALALAAALGGLASCRAAPAGTQTIVCWGLGREGEVLKELVPEFERTHPGLRVRVQQVPWTAAHEKLLTAFVGESTPDVAQLGNTWIPEFVAVGALAPLDARVAASAVVKPAGTFPGIWETNVVEGTLYGVPWYVDTRALFYRRDLLAAAGVNAAPRSWAEWREAMARVKAAGGPGRWGALLPINEWAQPVLLGVQNGAPLLRDGGCHAAFSDPRFRKAFEFYVGLFKDGLVPTLVQSQVSNMHQQFAAGDFAFLVTGPWNLGEMRRRLPQLEGRWAVAPLPHPDPAAGVPGTSLAGGSSLVLFRASPRQDAAFQLIEFLSRPEQQVRLFAAVGDLPAQQAAWDHPTLAGDAELRAFRAQFAHVAPMPRVPEWERIATRVAEAAEQAARGEATTEEALRRLDADVDRLLDKRRFLLARQGAGTSR
jgi:multiple sugar transport system substrate-binding protein